MSISFKWRQFEKEIILLTVTWYLRYPLSYRDLKEMMLDRGISVDHTTIYRWVIKYSEALEQTARKKKKPVGKSWRMDETYIKVKGKWKYLYRAVDKEGNTVEFLLTAKRDMKAAARFFRKALKNNDVPEKINIDKSGANTAGIKKINKEKDIDITIRRVKYLNNIIEQDHRFIKRLTKHILGFKSFLTAKATLTGIELMHMLRKNQIKFENSNLSFFQKVCILAS